MFFGIIEERCRDAWIKFVEIFLKNSKLTIGTVNAI